MSLPDKVLFIRVDRIGDLVLTLPVDQVQVMANLKVHWWIAKGLEFVLDSSARQKRTYDCLEKQFSFRQIFSLVKKLRQDPPDIAVIFHAPWWVSLVLWLAGVKVRGGRLSQWHSYLFLNRGFRQSRSLSEKHESEYNFELVEKVFNLPKIERPVLQLSADSEKSILQTHGLQSKNYFVVHPGMGGSARNASVDFYAEVIKNLISSHLVVVTGTPTDREWIEPLWLKLKGEKNIVWLQNKLSGKQMICILEQASAVLAPSTGVIHLAASTSVRTIGIYGPVRSQRASRWGPRGSNCKVFVPSVECPASTLCHFKGCPKFDCMNLLSVDDVANIMKT